MFIGVFKYPGFCVYNQTENPGVLDFDAIKIYSAGEGHEYGMFCV